MFSADKLRQFQALETPFYFYDLSLLNRTIASARSEAEKYGFHIHYAIKANSHPQIMKIFADAGFGADCVSGNEVKAAIAAGFSPDSVLFAGVGKSDKEINDGLNAGIQAFNVESLHEISVIQALSEKAGKKTKIALRINPNVDAKTHKYITTGLDENKFGINHSDMAEAVALVRDCENLELTGVHFHIGSQITDMNVFKGLCLRVNEILVELNDLGAEIVHINMGGGLGVDYEQPDAYPLANFSQYFSVFNEFLERRSDQQVHFELGRSLVAQCGSLITRVLYLKKGLTKQFAIVDAGMTHLLRPALYQSFHKIENLTSSGPVEHYDVVGPVCETTDSFGKNVALAACQRGDLLAIRTAGAYGEVMVSNYNLRDQNPSLIL